MEYAVHFAPLQGYTDFIYREAHAAVFGGIETYYTPFVRLEKNAFRTKELRDIFPEKNRNKLPVPQLIAASPHELRQIAKLFQKYGYQEADINLGCPFPMQARLHRGAGLLPYLDEVCALLTTVLEFPDIRFSVKLRLGWDKKEELLAILPLLNELPLKHITVHPRVGTQQYKGEVDLERFADIYQRCRHPLFYNGDLHTCREMDSILNRFPRLQGIMVGRGLLAHPWLANEFTAKKKLTSIEKGEKLIVFHDLLVKGYRSNLEGGEHQILSKLKTVWDYLLPEAEKKLRKKVLKSTTLSAYLSSVQELFTYV